MKRRKTKVKKLSAKQRMILTLMKGKLRMRKLNMRVGKTKMKLEEKELW